MAETGKKTRKVFAALRALLLSAMALSTSASGTFAQEGNPKVTNTNPVSYFEIPVSDMDRAIAFYETVFSISLERTVIDGHEMALFPSSENSSGISGALAKGDSYVPSAAGPRIYFSVENIDETLSKAVEAGGQVAYPKTHVGDFFVAEFKDSEGNQIALSSGVE